MRILLILLLLFSFSGLSFSESLEDIAGKVVSIKKEIQTEKDRWFEEKRKLLGEYRSLLERRKILSEESHDLDEDIEREKKKVALLEVELNRFERLKGEVSYLILLYASKIEEDIRNGIPFRVDERISEVEKIKEMARDPSVKPSEKLKHFLDLLSRELSLSYTAEVFMDSLNVGGKRYFGKFLRLGMLGLYFKTSSGDVVCWYDPERKTWINLPSSPYGREIGIAMEIVEKMRAPSLVRLPVGKGSGR